MYVYICIYIYIDTINLYAMYVHVYINAHISRYICMYTYVCVYILIPATASMQLQAFPQSIMQLIITISDACVYIIYNTNIQMLHNICMYTYVPATATIPDGISRGASAASFAAASTPTPCNALSSRQPPTTPFPANCCWSLSSSS